MELSAFLTYTRRDFKRTDKQTELLNAYNDMILWTAAQLPHGNYKFQAYVALVGGQEDYPIPSNAIHLLHPVRLLDGAATNDSGFPLTHLTKQEYDIREPNPNRTNPSRGTPSAYTVFSRSILLTPIPDSSTKLLEINWSKRPVALSDDDEVPSLGSEWDQVLKAGTLDRVYAGIGLTQESDYWAAQYRTADHRPAGLCQTLLDIERDREGSAIGQVQVNDL